jgi:hypothetical protein
MSASIEWHDVQSLPAPQARSIASTLSAPVAIALRTVRSETPRQRQTNMLNSGAMHRPRARAMWRNRDVARRGALQGADS